jgi:hypothetical protein
LEDTRKGWDHLITVSVGRQEPQHDEVVCELEVLAVNEVEGCANEAATDREADLAHTAKVKVRQPPVGHPEEVA